MEWEQRTEDTETDEEQWEEHVLHALWNRMSTIGMVSDIEDFEGLSTTVEEDSQDTDNQKAEPPINIKVNFMAEYSFAPLPHTPMRRYIGISATS